MEEYIAYVKGQKSRGREAGSRGRAPGGEPSSAPRSAALKRPPDYVGGDQPFGASCINASV